MGHGGFRPNAGRKPGSVNKFNKMLAEKMAEGGVMPLDYILAVMRDDAQDVRLRMDAAKAAAPFVHQKLNAVSIDLRADELTHEEWLGRLTDS